jgi:choline dehydrogenase-like flavoprotein
MARPGAARARSLAALLAAIAIDMLVPLDGPMPRTRRLLRSLATLLCPPEAVPDLLDPLLDDVELSLQAMPAAIRAALRAGLAAYELGAVARWGRPASRLAPEQAGRYLDAWTHGLAVQRELIKAVRSLVCLAYFELPAVKERLGYRPERWIARVTRHRLATYGADIARHADSLRAPEPLARIEAGRAAVAAGPARAGRPAGVSGREDITRDTVLDCDVVIVGSGAGGATAAAELAEAGLDVLVLEEGRYRDTSDFTPEASAMIRALYRDGGATMAIGQPRVLYQEGRVVGGSTVINGGMSWRTPERVLDGWAVEHGLRGIRARDMEPFFERVERRIHVRTQDPESIGRDNHLLRSGAEALGWKVIENLRNQVHCPGSNNCAFGCPTGAKQSALVSYIPRALHFGARVQADVRVERVTRAGKRATGVTGRVVGPDGRPGPRVDVRARLVISACGAVHTPALLARSGLRSPSGALGRHLSMHPNAKLVAIFDEDVRGWEGVHQAFQVREFQDQGLLFAAVNVPPGILAMGLPHSGAALGAFMADYPRMVVAGVLVEDSSRGRVLVDPLGQPRVLYQLGDADAARLVRGTALLAELLFAAGARRVLVPFEGAPALDRPDDIAALLRRPIAKETIELFTVHLMGTARMGRDRSRAVTDDFGHVHDAEGLMVCDASLFPGPIGVNPAETIQALTTRNVAHLIDNWSRFRS